jgi:hypothetical protein
MDARIEAFLADVLALEGENLDVIGRECAAQLADYE